MEITVESEQLQTKLGKATRVDLADLLLDSSNPRFGGLGKNNRTQADVLDHIVNVFGVDDLLSSLSINGYFEAEPLVARETQEGLVVAEGNRRLAACLMLRGDARALRQRDKAQAYIEMWAQHGSPQIDPAPVIVFGADTAAKELLSYLGVRHISAAKSWDSYAKAAWVADVVREHHLDVAEIARMIGDRHQTIDRLLQGYYLVQQLVESGQFRPNDSVKSGRGSVTEYPFSWVYSILGYSATQKYLDIQSVPTEPNPLQKKDLPKGAVLMTAMFGNKSKGRSSSLRDSRQLGQLASLLVDPETLTMIEQGKTVEEIEFATQSIEDKLRLGIQSVREILRDLGGRLDETPVSPELAGVMIEPSDRAAALSMSLVRKLRSIAEGNVDGKEAV